MERNSLLRQTPVREGLGAVRYRDSLASVEIGDSTRHPQKPEVCAGREREPLHRTHEKRSGIVIQSTVTLDEIVPHFGIGADRRIDESRGLHGSGGLHSFAETLAHLPGLAGGRFRDLPGLDARHMDHEIDTVEHRARELATVAFYFSWRILAGNFRIAEIATGTRIHGGHELATRGVRATHAHAIHGNLAVFERLTQSLENTLVEFQKLIEK